MRLRRIPTRKGHGRVLRVLLTHLAAQPALAAIPLLAQGLSALQTPATALAKLLGNPFQCDRFLVSGFLRRWPILLAMFR